MIFIKTLLSFTLLHFPLIPQPTGLTQSTTSKCINTNSINSTSNSISTSSMPTPILLHHHHPLRLHRQLHMHSPPTQQPHRQGRTQPLQRMRHPELTRHQEHMTPQQITMPHRGVMTLHLGTTMPRQEATTTRQAMTYLRATKHMTHQEHTQQLEATPHPHRMSRHPHTGNPCPSAMITLITRQNPLIDSLIPTHSFHTADVCVCAHVYLRKGQFNEEDQTGSEVVTRMCFKSSSSFLHHSYPSL